MREAFYITICRSDGLSEVTTRGGVKELNQPTAAQLDATPGADGSVDCYRRINHDDLKAVDWRRKLAGMLMNVLPNEHLVQNSIYILREIPEGFSLWEHIKYNNKENEKKTGGDQKKQNNAGGNYSRQDAYLYGHPQGRKKRYRSPADFFPHLLWLATDTEGDPKNCSCKICSPDGDEGSIDGSKDQADNKEPPAKKESPPNSSNSKTIPPSSSSVPPPNSSSSSKTEPSTSAPGKSTRSASGRSQEQELDRAANGKYLYRPGELIWFQHNPSWRLGVIGIRELVNNQPRYLIQPLSSPLQHQSQQIKDQETSLRPWLAYSVPRTTNPNLNDLSFEQVQWDRVMREEFNSGLQTDYIIDGSILAAKMIDASYSLFNRNESALGNPGEVHYNGMFLGGEKIWVGEPVRLRVPPKEIPDIAVLVIEKLIERIVGGESTVTFVGDAYKLVEMPNPYTNRSQWPTPDLPPRMIADLRFRNEIADSANANIWYEWRLLEPAARKELADIRGRWYETKTLLPILRPVEYQQDEITGKLRDVSAWMNGRRDNNKVPQQRRKRRRDTLGLSVPEGFKISQGLDGPPVDNVFPDQQRQSRAPSQFDGANEIDEFMDLDGAGVGQEYYASTQY